MTPFELEKNPRYFILYYSASWCPICRKIVAESADFYRANIAENPQVELVMMSKDKDSAHADEWAKAANMPWPILYYASFDQVEVARANLPEGIPMMILIDNTGDVIAQGRSEAMLKALTRLDVLKKKRERR